MVDKKYTWATEDIYKSVEEWEQSYKNVESMLDFSDFQGKLGDPQVFYKFTEKDALVNREIGKLSVYAMMKHDENTKISLYYSLAAKISSLCSVYGSKVAFVRPELTALDKEVLVSYINNPLLKDYSYQLTCILKEKAHVLSDSEEKLLAEGGEVFSCFSDIFGKIDNADLPLGKIRHNGKTIKLILEGYASEFTYDEEGDFFYGNLNRGTANAKRSIAMTPVEEGKIMGLVISDISNVLFVNDVRSFLFVDGLFQNEAVIEIPSKEEGSHVTINGEEYILFYNDSEYTSNIGYYLEKIGPEIGTYTYEGKTIKLDGIGNVNEAIRLFLEAVDINPGYTLACFNLGRAYQIIGDRTLSAKYYQDAINLNKLTAELDENDIQERLYGLFKVG